jgi:transposase
MRSFIRYSEAFKLQVIGAFEAGKFNSPYAASRAYGLSGGMVAYWVRRYGKNHLLRKVVRVQTPKEISEVQELRKRVRQLEKALVDAEIDRRLEKAYVEIACRAAGIKDVEDFKKKHDGKV